MAKAVLFIRVSTEKQDTESQKDALTLYALADGFSREDIVCIEKTESGYKLDEDEREGIAELYETMESMDVADVYVWELSRLSRRPKVLYSIRDKFFEKKIQLHCQEPSFTLLNKDRSGYDSNANILFSLFGAMAEQEVIEKKARFARGKKRLAEQGRYNGGAIPYGYKIDYANKSLIVEDEEEGKVVREIFDMYENGYSQMRIARELYDRGIKGRAARKTKRFTLSLVHQILTNELLTGAPHKSKGASYVRTYPMIITPEQFARCREIAKRNNKVQPKSLKIYYAHALIKCVECGRNFVGSGCKGYYHCRDAYNNDKKYNGYEGGTKCQNRVCISTNVMDSLLWALAIDYETLFILEDAQEKIIESQRERDNLQQKLDAIPVLLADIEERRQNLLLALAEGLNRAKYEIKKSELNQEVKRIEARAAEYKAQILHHDNLISEVQRSLDMDYDFADLSSIDDYLQKQEIIKAKVASITDDRERSDIIHKHIRQVSIEKTTIIHKFGIAPQGKETMAKKITVYPYSTPPETFYFIPFDGKGGTMLKLNPHAGTSYDPFTGGTHTSPEYYNMVIPYLQRTTDKGKVRRRIKEQIKKAAAAEAKLRSMEQKGFVSMPEMMELSGMSYSTLYRAIVEHKMSGTKVERVWFVKRCDFTSYLNKCKPKPRPRR